MSENRVLSRTVIPKEDERIDWRKLPKELIKSNRTRLTGHLACKRDWKCAQSFGRKT
jgi:hypothetical protein